MGFARSTHEGEVKYEVFVGNPDKKKPLGKNKC
jgi:hypothetical protein